MAGSSGRSTRPVSALCVARQRASTSPTSRRRSRDRCSTSARAAASSASYDASSRTGSRASTRSPKTASTTSSTSAATVGYGEPASPSLVALSRPSSSGFAGLGTWQCEQPAHPQPVARLLLVGGAHHPQADRVALVDERREALHLVAGAHLRERRLDRAERPRGLARSGRARTRPRPAPRQRRSSGAAASSARRGRVPPRPPRRRPPPRGTADAGARAPSTSPTPRAARARRSGRAGAARARP